MWSRAVKTDGLVQHVLEAGEGPLILFCHGFPELGWSWRRQLPVLAGAGWRAVAPDMRGYGGTAGPSDPGAYTILELVGDMVDLVRALGEETAVIVGHDWGAPVAWHAALLRPDVFRAVAGLSVPFQPRRSGRPPLATLKMIGDAAGLGEFYFLYFQEPGRAEAEFEADVAGALRRAFYGWDGAAPPEHRGSGFLKPGATGFLDGTPAPARLPAWTDEADLAVYVEAFERTGFTPPMNWYRCIDRNWTLTAFAQDRRIEVPALFMVGEKDPVRGYVGRAEAELSTWVPDLRASIVVEGAGHWLQQERADAVNEALLAFLQGL